MLPHWDNQPCSLVRRWRKAPASTPGWMQSVSAAGSKSPLWTHHGRSHPIGMAMQCQPKREELGWKWLEPETGSVGTVFFPETGRGTGTVGTFLQEPKPEPALYANCTETKKTPPPQRSRRNRKPEPFAPFHPKQSPNRTEQVPP